MQECATYLSLLKRGLLTPSGAFELTGHHQIPPEYFPFKALSLGKGITISNMSI